MAVNRIEISPTPTVTVITPLMVMETEMPCGLSVHGQFDNKCLVLEGPTM